MSPYRPIVAVVAYHLADDRVPRWPHGGYGVPGPYLDCLRRTEARTAILSPGEPGSAEEVLDPFDGLLLVGGGDVDPRRYDQTPGDHVYGVEPDRDAFEIDLLLAADRIGVPALCICRGMQVMNVAFGGTLLQHLPGTPGLLEHGVPVADTQSMHDVRTDETGRLRATTGVESLSCSSHHHQGVDRVGDGLRATGWSRDGLVEAIEREPEGDPDDRPYEAGWMLGVQWHPEDTADRDPGQQSLFDALSNLARLRGSRARPGAHGGRSRGYGIVDYDPTWPAAFETEAAAIRAALGDVAVRVEHIGSTAVPGLAAKAIVDIQVSVDAMVPRDRFVVPLVALGYEFVADPTDTEHEYFKKGGEARTFQIHVCPVGSEWERRHLAFRDQLRTHPDDAARYAELKRRLAAEHPNDVMTYVDGKTPFIREIEARSRSGADRAAR